MFKICYLDDFEYSDISQNIYSTFYVDINGVAFPDEQWTDFPLAILRVWSERLISNVVNIKSSVFNLTFLDGPFSIECNNVQGQILMQFINNRNKRKIEHEFIISANELIRSINKASRRMIWLIEQRNYGRVRDVEELSNLEKVLENHM